MGSTKGPARVLRFSDGSEVAAHAVIVATGVASRELGVPATVGLMLAGWVLVDAVEWTSWRRPACTQFSCTRRTYSRCFAADKSSR